MSLLESLPLHVHAGAAGPIAAIAFVGEASFGPAQDGPGVRAMAGLAGMVTTGGWARTFCRLRLLAASAAPVAANDNAATAAIRIFQLIMVAPGLDTPESCMMLTRVNTKYSG